MKTLIEITKKTPRKKKKIQEITMKAMQRKMGGVSSAVNSLEPTGFEVHPFHVVIGTAAFVLTVILCHFYGKLGGAKA